MMRAPQAKAAVDVKSATTISSATQKVLNPKDEEAKEEEDPDKKEAREREIEDLKISIGKGKEYGWDASIIKIHEDKLKTLMPASKQSPSAKDATKDIKQVASEQHSIQSNHEARLGQLEKSRDNWMNQKKKAKECQKTKLEEFEKEYKAKIKSFEVSVKEWEDQADTELATIETKVQTAVAEHARTMHDIHEYWKSMGKPVEETINKAADQVKVAGEVDIKAHLLKDTAIVNLQMPVEHVNAMTTAMHEYMKVEKERLTAEIIEGLKKKHSEEDTDDEELREEEQADGFGVSARQKKKDRQAAAAKRKAAVAAGAIIDDTPTRTAPTKREGQDLAEEDPEAARETQRRCLPKEGE
jgi:hypothetical protein